MINIDERESAILYIQNERYSGFKVGEKVRIKRKSYGRHENGWQNSWISDMDKYVGKVVTISEIHSLRESSSIDYQSSGISFNECACGFPYFILEKIDKPIITPISKREFKIGNETFMLPEAIISILQKE